MSGLKFRVRATRGKALPAEELAPTEEEDDAMRGEIFSRKCETFREKEETQDAIGSDTKTRNEKI